MLMLLIIATSLPALVSCSSCAGYVLVQKQTLSMRTCSDAVKLLLYTIVRRIITCTALVYTVMALTREVDAILHTCNGRVSYTTAYRAVFKLWLCLLHT